jgi:transcriptional regulator with XRE-family HTH domain
MTAGRFLTPEAVGTVVRRARVRRNWSQTELATCAGVTREWVGRLENGAPRLEFDKVLRTMSVLGLRVEAPADESANAEDIELANEIAWTMALEDRKLSSGGYDRLLDKIVADRLTRKQCVTTG